MSNEIRASTTEQDSSDQIRVDDLSDALSGKVADQVRGGTGTTAGPTAGKADFTPFTVTKST